jgi:hypothetical protein
MIAAVMQKKKTLKELRLVFNRINPNSFFKLISFLGCDSLNTESIKSLT